MGRPRGRGRRRSAHPGVGCLSTPPTSTVIFGTSESDARPTPPLRRTRVAGAARTVRRSLPHGSPPQARGDASSAESPDRGRQGQDSGLSFGSEGRRRTPKHAGWTGGRPFAVRLASAIQRTASCFGGFAQTAHATHSADLHIVGKDDGGQHLLGQGGAHSTVDDQRHILGNGDRRQVGGGHVLVQGRGVDLLLIDTGEGAPVLLADHRHNRSPVELAERPLSRWTAPGPWVARQHKTLPAYFEWPVAMSAAPPRGGPPRTRDRRPALPSPAGRGRCPQRGSRRCGGRPRRGAVDHRVGEELRRGRAPTPRCRAETTPVAPSTSAPGAAASLVRASRRSPRRAAQGVRRVRTPLPQWPRRPAGRVDDGLPFELAVQLGA